jgi:hypothetical protein
MLRILNRMDGGEYRWRSRARKCVNQGHTRRIMKKSEDGEEKI